LAFCIRILLAIGGENRSALMILGLLSTKIVRFPSKCNISNIILNSQPPKNEMQNPNGAYHKYDNLKSQKYLENKKENV
jgi:hypothetical protein